MSDASVRSASPLLFGAPLPAPLVTPEEAAASLVSGAAGTAGDRAREKARGFVAELAALDVRSPAFSAKAARIDSFGSREIRESGELSDRMLQRSRVSSSASGPQATVRAALAELRSVMAGLEPGRERARGLRGLLRRRARADAAGPYFAAYRSAQERLDEILHALAAGQDALRKENAAVAVEGDLLRGAAIRLGEVTLVVTALDEELTRRATEAGDPTLAEVLGTDVLSAVRRRHQDLLTQAAVTVQGSLAVELVRGNNVELIRGVEAACTTTVAALRTAVAASRVAGERELVLDRIAALDRTVADHLESASDRWRGRADAPGTAPDERADDAAREALESLGEALGEVQSTIDAIDAFSTQADDAMTVTMDRLATQLGRAGTAADTRPAGA